MDRTTLPAALSRLPWMTSPVVIARRRITDDCAPGRYDDTVYSADTLYDFGDEIFAV